jgi:MoaA/NifB/PqqE/SkfB family radical SAM enzyme
MSIESARDFYSKITTDETFRNKFAEEALDLVEQLAEVGIKEVTLIGGEAFRPDWLRIAEAITDAGMLCGMTTGGYGLSLETVRRMKDAGIRMVSVSTDGLEATHDRLRGKKGSWQSGARTMSYL